MEPLPTTIGRYVVEGLVGIGAMGRIYRAHDPHIRRTVAIKLISTKLMTGTDRADYNRRFRREAEAAARCVHPNIVAIYDFALHEGEPFLAMEFVDGISLREALDKTPILPVPDAIGIMVQVLDALEVMHGKGVVHHDIKPGNIMLTMDKQVKVGDFGVSKITDTEMTTTFVTAGTPAYMSPEQCRGETVDGRSDLFAAGTTLFEMLSGRRAFSGRNATEVSHRIQNERLQLLPMALGSAVPRLQLVLDRATNKLPEERFDSAFDMSEALRQVLSSLNSDGTRVQPHRASIPTKHQQKVEVAPSPKLASSSFDPEMLRWLEGRLREYMGPIASVMLRKAARRSRTSHELVAELSSAIRDEAERTRFLGEVQGILRHSTSNQIDALKMDGSESAVADLPEHEIERAQATLTIFVGPIARVLVRRVAVGAPTIEALWNDLSEFINVPEERAAFLRHRKK